MIYLRTPSSSSHASTKASPMCSPPTNLAKPTAVTNLWYCFRNVYRYHRLWPGLESALYIHTPPLFQVELEKVSGCPEHWTIQP